MPAPCKDRHVIFTVDGTLYHGFDKCAPGTVDGIFGDKSRAATIRFREKNGLRADGSIGPKTWPKLRDLEPTNCRG